MWERAKERRRERKEEGDEKEPKVMGEGERERERKMVTHLEPSPLEGERKFWASQFQWAQLGRTKSFLVVWDLSMVTVA